MLVRLYPPSSRLVRLYGVDGWLRDLPCGPRSSPSASLMRTRDVQSKRSDGEVMAMAKAKAGDTGQSGKRTET